MLYNRVLTLLLAVATMTMIVSGSLAQEVKSAEKTNESSTAIDAKTKIRVEMLQAEAKTAMRSNNPAKAVSLLERAAKLDPEDVSVRRQLTAARQLTATTGTSGGIIDDVAKSREIAKQMATHDIRAALKKSMEFMANPTNKDAFEAAEQNAKIARNVLNDSKGYFSTAQRHELLKKINEQLTWIESKRSTWERQQIKQKMKEIENAERVRTQATMMKKKQRVAELTMQAQKLRSEGKYKQALAVLDQILSMDTKNAWAVDNKYMLRRFMSLQQARSAQEEAEMQTSFTSAKVREAAIPWYILIRYPKDWVALTERRKQYSAVSGNDTEEDRQISEKLAQNIKKLDFQGVSFQEVVNYLRDVTGTNIDVNWRALEAAGIERTQSVEVNLRNVSFKKAIDVVLSNVGGGATELGYVVDQGVITISTKEDLDRLTETRVYDIRDLIHRVPNFIGQRVALADMSSALGDGSSSSGSGGGGGGDSIWGDSDSEDESETGLEDSNMTKSEAMANLKALIVTTIDPTNWRPDGEKGSISTINGNLVITQTEENHRKIENLIATLREARNIQVSVESRFITVNTGFLNQIGVDLDFYFNLNGTGSSNQLAATSPQYNNGSGYNNNYNRFPSAPVYNKGWSPIGATQDSNTFSNVMYQTTNVTNGIGSVMNTMGVGPGLALAGTFLDDIQVDFLITATQAHQHTRQLNAPRLTLFNGQRAYVSVQTSRAYISGVEQVVSENASAPQPIISYVPTGAMLDVDVTVSHDRRYVTMTLRPQVIDLRNMRQQPVFGQGTAISIELPEIELQDIQTTVTIPDGGTLLIGGQKLSAEVEREMGVPVLSKLPVVNRAFTNKGKLRDESTLLILIKPKIIIIDEVEDDPSHYEEEPTMN